MSSCPRSVRSVPRSRSWLRSNLVLGAVLAGALAGPGMLSAQETPNHLFDKFQVSGGSALLLLNTDIRVDAANGDAGTEIDAEDDLGLDVSKPFGRLGVRWRPWRRHSFDVNYQWIRRGATYEIERDITWGDTTFNAGASLRPRLNSDVLGLTWRWAIHQTDRWQVGPAIGIGLYFFEAGIEGTAVAGGSSVNFDESVDQLGPTASLGVFSHHRLADELYAELDARALYVSIDRFSGTVLEIGATARWFLADWVGLTGGYALSGVRVDVDPRPDAVRSLLGRVQYTYHQLRAGVVLVP